MTGLAIVLGSDRAQHATYIQVAGKSLRISAIRLREADEHSNTLHRAMLRFAHAFLAQTTTTALANSRSKTEERLARWLLMSQDRIRKDTLPLTQEFLSQMLGARRASVSVAAAILQRAGLIQYSRGHVSILNRAALEDACCECYKVIRQQLEKWRKESQ